MSIETIKKEALNKKIQVIEVTNSTEIVASDNTIFKLKPKQKLTELHPFFYTLVEILQDIKEPLQFPCVNIEIENTRKIIDIDILKKGTSLYLVFIDFSEHYKDSQPLVQEKNESSIAKNKLSFERELLYAKEEFKNQFLSHLNHEIRSPLNNLIGFTDILAETNLTFQQKETVNVIKKTGMHIKVLMDDLLDISKIETGNIEIKHIPFNLTNIVVNIIKHFQIKKRNSSVEVAYSLEKEVPVKYYGDPTRINQILYNLLNNAYNNTIDGAIVLDVSLASKKGKIAAIVFKISDTGVGIAKEELPKIFESYKQLELDAIKPIGEGLGLKIVKDLSEVLNGSVSVTSKKEKGSVFTVTLPLEVRNTYKEKKTVPKGSGIFMSKRILIIEDDQISQMLFMKQFLNNEEGYQIEMVSSIEQAKERLSSKSYTAIITKIKLPNKTVKTLFDFVKNHSEETPIIVASGKAMIDEQEQTIADGASLFLKKPYTKKELFKALKKVI